MSQFHNSEARKEAALEEAFKRGILVTIECDPEAIASSTNASEVTGRILTLAYTKVQAEELGYEPADGEEANYTPGFVVIDIDLVHPVAIAFDNIHHVIHQGKRLPSA